METEPSPSLRSLDAATLVRRARHLRFRVRPQAVSALSGAYLGARPGIGLTFAELRAYEPGDDVRHLDWNVTARQGRPYLRRFVEERSLTLHLVVDVSASMRFGPDGRSKADRAAQAAALVAAAAIQNGDRVGLLLVTDRIELQLVPREGPRQLAQIVRGLVSTPSISRKTLLSTAIKPLIHARRRSLTIILSDFIHPGPAASWRALSRRGDLLAIRFVEPREETLPRVGLVALQDAETGASRLVDFGSADVRRDYEIAAHRRRTQFRSWCSESAILGHDASTDEDPVAVLLRIFRGRVRGRDHSR